MRIEMKAKEAINQWKLESEKIQKRFILSCQRIAKWFTQLRKKYPNLPKRVIIRMDECLPEPVRQVLEKEKLTFILTIEDMETICYIGLGWIRGLIDVTIYKIENHPPKIRPRPENVTECGAIGMVLLSAYEEDIQKGILTSIIMQVENNIKVIEELFTPPKKKNKHSGIT